jgi:uncharacterized protein YjbJ (UPF0337 family)
MKHKLGDAKLTVEGVKDKLMGGVKQKVGHLLGKPHLEAEGRDQRLKGKSELKHHRGLKELTPAQAVEMHLRREALFADIDRSGGFARLASTTGRLRHVELLEERDVKDLFSQRGESWQRFSLKSYNKQPLLKDIREGRTRKPLVHVETVEKGLLRSIKLDKKGDFKLKPTDRFTDLWADIKGGDHLARLKCVKREKIRDRSAPRLDLFKNICSSQANRDRLFEQIEQVPKRLNHVTTIDKARPELLFEKESIGTGAKKVNKAQLLNELRSGGAVELKHVVTEDKCKPMIGDDVSVRTWNKEGFLAEVRQGTELKHI